MQQTLASSMARKSFDPLLERVAQEHEFSPDETRELLAGCQMGVLVLERLWQLTRQFLDQGMESKKLRFLLKEVVDVIEVGIEVFDAAHSRVKLADIASQEKTDAVSMLEGASRRAAEMRDESSGLLNWLEAPPSKGTPSSLPEGRGEREAAGYIGHDDLTARLLSGGDL